MKSTLSASKRYRTISSKYTTGKVCIIGDVHGSYAALKAVLDSLAPEDVLIIAGDLADRGESDPYTPTSAPVLDLVIEHAEAYHDGSKPCVYAIKGNHEIDFLYLMDLFRQLKNARDDNSDDLDTSTSEATMEKLFDEVYNRFEIALKNGTGWILNREDPLCNQLFTIIRASHSKKLTPEKQTILQSSIVNLIENLLSSSDDPFDWLIPNIADYEAYFNTLPYVIRIKDERAPAWVVHADCPFDDRILTQKCNGDVLLKLAEIEHLAYTRPDQFSAVRTENSALVYCGHNIVDSDAEETSTNLVTAVRASTNTINLDVGAYFRQGFVVVDHFNHTAQVVSDPDIPEEHELFLTSIATSIDAHLERYRLSSDCEFAIEPPRTI